MSSTCFWPFYFFSTSLYFCILETHPLLSSALTRRMSRCQSAWLSWTSAALIPTQKTYSAQWPSSKLSHFYSSLNWSHWIFFKNVQKCLKHYWYEIPSMITEMWSRTYKRVITECQRKKLRSLAWRRLNKILPWRYLHWLFFFLTSNFPFKFKSNKYEPINIFLLQWEFWCWYADRSASHG